MDHEYPIPHVRNSYLREEFQGATVRIIAVLDGKEIHSVTCGVEHVEAQRHAAAVEIARAVRILDEETQGVGRARL